MSDPLVFALIAALAVLGAADAISVFVRGSLIQLHTPDDMRGRVSSVSGLFISASNELGELESGLAARYIGAVPGVVIGGIGAIIVTVVLAMPRGILGVLQMRYNLPRTI